MSDILAARARMAIVTAVGLGKDLNHPCVLPIHLLAGLFAVPGSALAGMMDRAGVNEAVLRAYLAESVTPDMFPTGRAAFSPEASAVLNEASALASSFGMALVDDGALTLALVEGDDTLVAAFLTDAGLAPETISEQIRAEFESFTPPPFVVQARQEQQEEEATLDPEPFDATPATPTNPLPKDLADFVTDLTAATDRNPVYGREAELDRLHIILGRRTKNNPVLVGEPGVGKSAIVEALAAQISTGNAPESLQGAQLLSVDMGSLMAGTRNRGDFEERIKKLLDYTTRSTHPIILFFDEIHTMVGAGATGDSSMGAGNLLKPALARGEVRVLGATTFDEYRKYIEKDAALERRFAKIEVSEPDTDLAVLMLSNWVGELSTHHSVMITPEAVVASVKLSDKWLTERRLPDKAIDVLDESCARLHLFPREGETPTIDATLVAEVVSAMTGIPLTSVDTDAAAGLMGLKDRIAGRVVGQDDAVAAVTKAVLRRRSGVDSMRRPASFLFAGPTGVGKTELAKVLADEMLGVESSGSLVTIDCSELDSEASVAKLVGAPPGYVGYGEGGRLTEAVRRNKNAVVLFDEADKAHPKVFDILLQMLEEGHVTDAEGRKVNFSATTVILTSNHGAAKAARSSVGFATPTTDKAAANNVILQAVKEDFRPEFLNRLDKVVVFHPLDIEHAETIAALQVARITTMATDAGLTVRIDPGALTQIAKTGFDAVYGARSLHRTIQRLLTDPLADMILAGKTGIVKVTAGPNDELVFTSVKSRARATARS